MDLLGHEKKLFFTSWLRTRRSQYSSLSAQPRNTSIGVAALHPPSLIEEAPATTPIYTGPDYLEALSEHEVVIRSPGISPRIPELLEARKSGTKFTSATNFFMEEARSIGARVIGITGRKGKSSTKLFNPSYCQYPLLRRALSRQYRKSASR